MPAKRSLLKKTLIITLASMTILAGLMVGGVQLLDQFAPQYRQALAHRMGARIHAKVSIARIDLRWDWTGPLLKLRDVSVTGRGQSVPAVTLKSVGLHFSFPALLHGKRLPDGLVLDSPHLSLQRNDDGRLQLQHWPRASGQRLSLAAIERLRTQLAFVRVANAQVHLLAPSLPAGQAVLSNVNASLRNGPGRRWQVSFTADGPAWWPHLAGHAALVGPLTQLDDATFDIATRGVAPLVLAHAANHLNGRLGKRLSGGRISVHLRGRWQNQKLRDASADIALAPVQAAGQSRPLIPALTARFDARSGEKPGRIHFALDEIHGALPGLRAVHLAGHVDTRHPEIRLEAQQLPSRLAVRLAHLRFPKLAGTAIALGIDNLALTVRPGDAPKLACAFSRLTVDAPQLSFGPLGGSYYQQGPTHVLTFARAGGTLAARHFLNGALPVSAMGGALSWHRDHDGLHIDAQNLGLSSQQAHVSVSGSVDVPRDGAPVVDLTADMRAPHVARLLKHVPQAPDLPNRRLRDWLPKAITTGSLDDAHLRVVGPLDRFPFAKPRAGEHFHLEMTGHGVDVHYKPGWPPLTQGKGRLTLDGDTLNVALKQAHILDLDLAPSSGHVADVREPVLHVNGHVAHGQASRMLAFLTDSPLKQRFGKLASAIDLRGAADLDIQLRIPLKPGLGKVQASGTFKARDDTLRQKVLPAPITGINGQVAFDNHGLSAHGLTGNLLGMALRTDLQPVTGAYQRVLVHATTLMPDDRALLAHYLPARWLMYAKGSTPAQIAFRVRKAGRISHLKITSTLAGMAINLPAPLHKAAAQPAPLSVQIAPDAHQVTAHYDNRLTLTARLAGGHATRIQALIGPHAPSPPNANGLWIGGQTATVDGLGWFKVLRHVLYGSPSGAAAGPAANTKPTTRPALLPFIGGDLKIGKLRLGDRYFENTQIRAQPMQNVSGWRVNVNGANTQGQITWTARPNQRMAIAGNLALLALQTNPKPADKGDGASKSPVLWPDVSPLALPRINLYVQNFKVDGTRFGQMHVQASALPDGWQLDRFDMRQGVLTGTASARWIRDSGITQASAQTDLDGHGLSRLLRTFGYKSPIQARSTRIHSKLMIKPNPNGLDLRALDGNLSLAMDHGTLLSVEPGPGRLLGLFNLYVLPRRLRLDFRDVVDKGMAFDKVRADFDIRNGNAFSKNTRIKTPSSNITIKGRIGLAARDYDEHVTITPKVGSGLAIASTLFGGPLIGAAVFAVQELLKQPIKEFSSVGYTLKGSWDNPTIAEPVAKH